MCVRGVGKVLVLQVAPLDRLSIHIGVSLLHFRTAADAIAVSLNGKTAGIVTSEQFIRHRSFKSRSADDFGKSIIILNVHQNGCEG